MLVPRQIAADWQNGALVPFCLLSCHSSKSVSYLTSIWVSGACLSAIADPWKHVWAGVTACFVYKQQHADMFLSTIVQFWGILQMQWFWIFSQDHFYLQWWGYRCEVWVLTLIACVLGDRSKSSCQNRHVKNLS